MKHRNIAIALMTATSAVAFPANAQTDGATDTAAAPEAETLQREGGLQEIVVTAQKTSESLQRVPLSLTAFSGDALQESGVRTAAELAARTPNVAFDVSANGNPRYFIRGIGSSVTGSGRDTAVGIFVDEVYMGRPQMTRTDFFDLDRVEILRGPQGTLFGRNVVGGAISYFTTKPTDELRMEGAATVGNYGRMDANMLVSGPLTEGVSAKFGLSTQNHDGYAFNETTRQDIEWAEMFTARGALRFQSAGAVDLQLNGDISRVRGSGAWWHLLREGPNSIGKSNANPRRGPNHPDDGFNNIDHGGVSLNARIDTAIGEVASISAYRELDSSTRANGTALFVAPLSDPNRNNFFHTLFIQQSDVKSRQLSQELRLATQIGTDIDAVLGVFYFWEKVDSSDITDYRFQRFRSEGRRQFDAENITKSYAAFANVAWDVTDRLKVRAGLRWSLDEKRHVVVAGGNNFTPYRDRGVIVPGFVAPGEAQWSAFTPSLSVNFQPTANHMLYASASRGFKSGGFSDSEVERLSAMTPFDPEFAWNYEVGAKTEWFDRRLRFNASLFYTDYTDLQVTVIRVVDPNFPPFGTTGNAGKVVIKGAELELNAIPLEGWNIYGNYAYTDSDIKEMASAPATVGNRLARSPEHKFFVGTSYIFAAGSNFTIEPRVEYSQSSEFFTTINNSPVERVDGLENLDVGIKFAREKVSLDLWVKNLTDELNIGSLSEVPPMDGYSTFMPPRTFGATLRFRY